MNNKLTVYNPPFPGMKSYREVIDFACSCGIKNVEPFCTFEFATPDTEKAKEIREYAEDKGIKFVCFSVYATISSDAEKTTERLKGYADVASILGSPYLHHTIVGEVSNPQGVLERKEELFNSGIKAVRDVFDYAQTKGVKTIYEDQGFIFNGIEGFGEFIEKVDRNVGVVADVGNIYQVGDTIEDFIKAFHDKIEHAHIKDIYLTDENINNVNCITLSGQYMSTAELGEGCVDWKGAIDLLRSYGYDGYYSLEYAAKEDGSELVEDALKLIDSWLR